MTLYSNSCNIARKSGDNAYGFFFLILFLSLKEMEQARTMWQSLLEHYVNNVLAAYLFIVAVKTTTLFQENNTATPLGIIFLLSQFLIQPL